MNQIVPKQWASAGIAVFAALAIIVGVLAELSFHVRSTWYVALFAGLATYIIVLELVELWRDRDRRAFSYEQPTEADIQSQYECVQGYAEALGSIYPGMLESANFLLDEAKSDFERVSSSSDSHEEKARVVLGIVAGATSALGIFGVARDGRTIVPSPLVMDSLALILLAFVCLLYVLRVKRYTQPNLTAYFAGAMVRQELRVALVLSLTPGYARMTAELAHRIRHEPRAIFIAYIATVSAAVMLLLNAAVVPTAAGTPKAGPTVLPGGTGMTSSGAKWR